MLMRTAGRACPSALSFGCGSKWIPASGGLVTRTHSREQSNKSIMGTTSGSLVINKNMKLRFCNSSLLSSTSRASAANTPAKLAEIAPGNSRPLVVLISWLMAAEKNLEKYRTIYFRHGFDVLTVKTSPVELLFPTIGAQKVAKSLFDFLKNQISTYPNVVIHGFSVGAYQFSELLVKLQQGLYQPQVDATCEIVRKGIKGMIFDSAVDVEGAPYGVSRSVLGETAVANMLEKMIKGHMKLFYSVATKHYEVSSKAFFNTPLRCPALLLVSRDDKLGNPEANERVAHRWREMGIDVSWKCWEKSRHVAHLHNYPKEYVAEVDRFLHRIHLGKDTNATN